MKRIWKICFLFFLIGWQTDFVLALENPKVIINEICWMGTEDSANNEWLELFNQTDKSLNLEGWFLKADDDVPKIKLSGVIPANSFYLLERTDDNTLPEISADQIYKGALENTGENLKLFDNSGNLIDEVICQDKWLVGDNQTKQTMERTKDGNWQTSQNPSGTPKAKNSLLTDLSKTTSEKLKTPELNSGVQKENKSPTTSAKIAALLTAFASAFVIVFLKKNLKAF